MNTRPMDVKQILDFLSEVMRNNNREWFHANKATYDAARDEFERGVAQAIGRITEFDHEIDGVTVNDSTYRFYRDTRFSQDKSPYKNHFGAYINAHGKKALRGGYYIHIEPDHCLLAVGNYWLPTNILTSCRNEMMANEERWLQCVESSSFKKYYGSRQKTTNWAESWDAPQGFGLTKLKTCPTGFPRNYAHVNYLRLKDYCAWHHVNNGFFEGDKWLDEMALMFKAAKPMMDFVNSVIDDYE